MKQFYFKKTLIKKSNSALIVKLLYQSEIVQRKAPQNLAEDDKFLFSAELTKVLPMVNINQADKAFLTPSGHLFKGPVLDVNQFNLGIDFKTLVKNYLKGLLSIFNLRKVTRVDRAYFFTNSNTTNFFHWFLDSLQKLELLSDVLSGEEKDHVFIIPANHNASFIINSLPAFGFTFIIQKVNQLLLVDSLTVVPDIAPSGNYRKEIVLALSERLRSQFTSGVNEQEKIKKVYITRRNAEKRKIINEVDLISILQINGFEICDMDNISFGEQINIMTNADVLISLHGAGLTHMLWMKKSSTVLEIRARDDSSNNCYFTLASDLGINYYYALADKTDLSLSTQQSDYTINPNHFEEELLQMLNKIKV